jgi:hypothetical protein
MRTANNKKKQNNNNKDNLLGEIDGRLRDRWSYQRWEW